MLVTFNNLSDTEFYSLFLQLINHAIKHDDRKIADMERKMISYFMALPEKYDHKRFSREAKRKIKKQALDEGWVLSGLNINNKIYSLVKKGFLRRDEDQVIYLNDKLESLIKERRKVKKNTELDRIRLTFDFT